MLILCIILYIMPLTRQPAQILINTQHSQTNTGLISPGRRHLVFSKRSIRRYYRTEHYLAGIPLCCGINLHFLYNEYLILNLLKY